MFGIYDFGISINSHSSIRIDCGKVIYFDPFEITDARGDADVIFITHPHYDHYSPVDIKKTAGRNTLIIGTADTVKKAQSDLPGMKCLAVSPGFNSEACGVEFETVAAYNKNKPFHPKANGWAGYVIKAGGARIYVCGDTDGTDEASAVGCDVLLVPAGGKYTTDAAEAAALAEKISPAYAVPTHYGSVTGTKNDGKTFISLLPEGIEGRELIVF